jgi:hypothetical protein
MGIRRGKGVKCDSEISITLRMVMSLTDMRNVRGEADLEDGNNEFNLRTIEFMVPTGHLA